MEDINIGIFTDLSDVNYDRTAINIITILSLIIIKVCMPKDIYKIRKP